MLQKLFDFLLEFGLLERTALNLVHADGVDKELGAQNPAELAHVEFGYENFLIALENVADVWRQRIQIAQMEMADAFTTGKLFPLSFDRRRDGAVRRAPSDNQEIALLIAFGFGKWDILGDRFDLCGAKANHFFVVQRLVVDIAADVLFFKTTNAMFEAGCAGDGPWARERDRVAPIGLEVDGIRFKLYR